MLRIRPPIRPVTLHFDGTELAAQHGEPVAASLWAAGYRLVARSPKFHRPRGPACFRGGCDGCLARVDGIPNVMTCRLPATDGMHIETQNVVGSRDMDLLRVTDWFFPDGMNHHEIFAGTPGVRDVMQVLARRVAGLGILPSMRAPTRAAQRRSVDVLVIGAGPAGMAAATKLAGARRSVEVIDESLAWGEGFSSWLGDQGHPGRQHGPIHVPTRPRNRDNAPVRQTVSRLPQEKGWAGIVAGFADAVRRGVELRLRTTAAGIYGSDVLVASENGVDMSARAACQLLRNGIRAGERPVVVVSEGGGPFGEAYAEADRNAVLIRGTPTGARGRLRVREATVGVDGERKFTCDALLVDAPRAPAYELCVQAGADVTRQAQGFVVRTGPGSIIRRGVLAVGETVGTPFDPDAFLAEANGLDVS
ncbi:MAG: (2Fe-2S)-binding protein [Polyangiaceae bacterium]